MFMKIDERCIHIMYELREFHCAWMALFLEAITTIDVNPRFEIVGVGVLGVLDRVSQERIFDMHR